MSTSLHVKSITTSTTLDNSLFDTYLVDATAGSIVLTLPNVSASGVNFNIKRTDFISTNNVTLTPASGTINGAASFIMNQSTEINAFLFGGNWFTAGQSGYQHIARVDQLYGNDTTATINGSSFLTINAAIASINASARIFVTIWLMPGNYNETVVLPVNCALRGLCRNVVFIQNLNVTADTDLVTMNTNTRVEDITLNLTSSGHFQLRGVVFPGTTTSDDQISQISTVIILVNNSTADSDGTSNVYGIHSIGTGSSFEDRQQCQNVITQVNSIGAGNKRGLLIDNASTFTTQNCTFLVNGTGATGSYIGVETNHASAIANIRTGTTRGFSSDISQTLGSLTVGAMSLPNGTANGLGFDTIFRPTGIIWADAGALPAGTSFYRVGTAAVTATLLGPIRISHKCIVKLLSITARVTPGATDTWTVFKNGVATALTASMTTPALFAQNTTVSVTFALADTIGIQVIRGIAGVSDTVVQVELY